MARGSKGGSRKRRPRRKGWAVAAVAILIVALWFSGEHPGWAAGTASLLVAVFIAALVVRRRMIEANRQRFLAANTELEKVDRLSGTAFEHLIAERLIADGFHQVRERGRAGDGGVDITAVAPGYGRYAIQCKRYSRTVGAPEVRNFLGALANTFAGYTGVLVTSGRLTKPARLEALSAREPLILVERDRLADWLLGTTSLLPGRATEN